MTGSSDLSPYMSGSSEQSPYRQGTVVAWDSSTGNNVIEVGGRHLTDLAVLATSDSVQLAPGDSVLVFKFLSTFGILGRFAAAGAGSLGVRSASVAATSHITTTSYGDLASSSGPTLSNVYVGSSRQCLVTVSTAIYPSVDNTGAAHFSVTGSSTINPPTGSSAFSQGAFIGCFSGGAAVEGTATKNFLLTAADGLNQGFHTFTMKYLARTIGGDDTFFSDRVISVQPL